MGKFNTFAIALIFLSATSLAEPVSEEHLKQEAIQRIQQLGSGLKGALQSAMKSGGPLQAIEVCHLQAPQITHAVNDDSWTIGRTSLRTRNADNDPDEWERSILKHMQSSLEAGTPISELTHSETVQIDGQLTFRFIKAIPTQAICLKCHGDKDQFDVNLKEKLESLYPNDQATGFKEGDIRGAFTLRKTL